MIRFEKVSFEEFEKCLPEELKDRAQELYSKIKLPQRATSLSAGYDFFAPFDFTIDDTCCNTVFPTGVRFVTDRTDLVLMCVPRSGLGFKYGLNLRNTVGIIDADYQYSDNEGHIKVKFRKEEDITILQGQAFMQGIITTYIKVDNDNTSVFRNGGFGSTDNVYTTIGDSTWPA